MSQNREDARPVVAHGAVLFLGPGFDRNSGQGQEDFRDQIFRRSVHRGVQIDFEGRRIGRNLT